MKRIFLLFATAVCVLGAIAALGQFSGPVRIDDTPARPPVFQVIASNAPTFMRHRGPGVYLCDGTNDEVQIQAADAAAAASAYNKATVKFSPGLFTISNPGNDDAVSGVADASSADPCVLSNITFDGSYMISDVAQGQVYRISVDDGADPADNDDDVMMTVTATSTGPDTITLSQKLSQAYTGADNVKFTRMVGCLKMSKDVIWEGCNAYETTLIKMAASQDCCMIVIDNQTSAQQAYVFRNLYFHGNESAQTSAVKHNGLVFNDYVSAITLDNIGVTDFKGHGVDVADAHGFHVLGDCWFERNGQRAISIGAGDHTGAMIRGGHIAASQATGILLKNCTDIQVCPALCRATGSGAWGLKMVGAVQRIPILGCYFRADTSAAGCIYMKDAFNCPITGNVFGVSHAGPAIEIDGGFVNTISANVLHEEGEVGSNYLIKFDHASAWYNTVYANASERRGETRRILRCKNDSGSTIGTRLLVCRHIADAASQQEMTLATAAGRNHLLGVHYGSTADGAWGVVLVEGYTEQFPISAGEDIAIGDLLTVGSTDDGYAQEAASGEMVIAIAEEADASTSKETYFKATLVKPFIAP